MLLRTLAWSKNKHWRKQAKSHPGSTWLLRSLVGFNEQWLSNMEEIQRLQAPEASFPPALQWTDRAPILFPLTNMVLYGLGFTAGLAAVMGFMWALWRMVSFRSDWMSHAIPVIWSGAYFLFHGHTVGQVGTVLPTHLSHALVIGGLVFVCPVGSGQKK